MIAKVLSQKLVLLVIGLAAGSGILIPVSYASFHPVTSNEIQDGTIQTADLANNAITSAKIKDGEVKAADIGGGAVTNAKIANGAVNSAKIADGTITYGDVSKDLIAVEHRDDCNCGGTGWDPDGTLNIETLYDNRITSTSVVSVTGVWPYFDIVCWTNLPDGFYDRVYVNCNKNIPNGFAINYAIFNNPAYGNG